MAHHGNHLVFTLERKAEAWVFRTRLHFGLQELGSRLNVVHVCAYAYIFINKVMLTSKLAVFELIALNPLQDRYTLDESVPKRE